MSNFNITTNIDNNSKIVYDYNNTQINKNDLSIINNYLTFNVTFPVNTPNISFPDNIHTYNANKMNISSVLHNNIAQLQSPYLIGELIIEHVPITGSGKLYTCFLLESNPDIKTNEKNDIDKLIELYKTKGSLTFNLNKTIPSQEICVRYTNADQTILVFLNPIYVNNDSYKFITSEIKNSDIGIPNYNSNYSIITKPNIMQRGEDEIYIDCNPTGESAETIATYNVPIASEYTRDWGKLDFMKMTIQLLIIFIFILIAYFGVPIWYKNVVVDNIKRLIKNDSILIRQNNTELTSNAGQHIRNITVDNLIIFLSFFVFIYTLLYGVTSEKYEYIQYAVYFFVFFGLSVSIIMYNKGSKYFKDEYLIPDIYTSKYKGVMKQIGGDILTFIVDSFTFYINTFHGKNEIQNYKNWTILISLFSLFFIPLVIFRWGLRTINHKTFTFFSLFSTFFVVIPATISYLLCMYKINEGSVDRSSMI